MTAPLPGLILAVSDLHLATGRNEETSLYDATENFFADDSFARFLRHHDPVKTPGGATLVLVGDIFDYLRIADYPKEPADLEAWSRLLAGLERPMTVEALKQSISRKERRFGLKTHDYKTVWKLGRITRGHRGFFQSLGWWTSRGGSVVFVKGNHDVEMHWPLVRRCICQEIAKTPGAVPERVTFEDDQAAIGNVLFRHGHDIDPVTRVSPPDPLMPGGEEIRLPLGSFVNRYIINRLETLDPFLDNIKPVETLLWTIVRKHPLSVARLLWYAIPFVRRAARPQFFRGSLGFILFLTTLVLPLLTLSLVVLFAFVEPVREWILGVIRAPWLRTLLSVAGVASPWIIGFIRDVMIEHKPKPKVGKDEYGKKAHEVLSSWKASASRLYCVMGHTHRPDVQGLGSIGGAEGMYLNSGSWTPNWRVSRPDLNGQVIYTFIEFTLEGGEYRHRILEWRDDRGADGAPAPARIIDTRES